MAIGFIKRNMTIVRRGKAEKKNCSTKKVNCIEYFLSEPEPTHVQNVTIK